ILVLSTLWALVLAGAACMTSSRAGGGGVGGSRDSGTPQPGTGGGAGGAAGGDRTCSMTPSGCFCLQGTDPGLAGCNTTSVVKNSGERGACCDDGSGFCKCDAYSCKSNPTTKICVCGTSVTVGLEVMSGSQVAECPAPT